ncbi:MAG TPA: hypothetical protein VFA99_09560 [Acidobacteriaceae bacterium]|nr:hypothetical protein [Acidobacteriaceae bacterium]
MSSIRLIQKAITFAGLAALLLPLAASGQNFGSPLALTRKRIVLERKLPPTGHIDGTGIKVVVNGVGVGADVAATLKSTLEDILLRNDPRLRGEDAHPDTIITCTIMSYAQPAPTRTQQSTVSLDKKKPAQPEYTERVTGMLTVGFKAASRTGHTIAADNVKSNYDRDFTVSANGNTNTGFTSSIFHSVSSATSHITKGSNNSEEQPPTPIELRDKLLQDAAMQIASNLVNTTEQVTVNLARGGGLDEPVKLMENRLYSRALEALSMMQPFPAPEEDAYRLYDIGVANEALAYTAEDVNKARTFLQQAAINYGKAIDAKPTEKNFLEPQNRIDTALAHYKSLSEEAKTPAVETTSARTSPSRTVSDTSTAHPAADPPSDAMTNDQVIEMVAAHIDEGNIIDDIQHAPEVHFDLSVQGQVYLSQHGVNGRLLSAMKTRERGAPATHRASR